MMEKIEMLPYEAPGATLGLVSVFGGIVEVFIVFPIIFNYIIIPRIEKRVGKKLIYRSLLYVFMSNYMWLFGGERLLKYVDLVPFIFIQYINWKFRLSRKIDPFSALFAIRYDIRKASRLEIFMSLFFYFSCVFFSTLLFISWVLMRYGY